jgi:hypothetical protein
MKHYFKLKTTQDWDYFFESKDKEVLRFAWGWNGKRKFIIESLVNLYWEQEGQEIFNRFLSAIENIKNISDYWEKTGIFVLYEKRDVFEN